MQKNDSHVFVEIDRAVCLISADTACGYGAEYECVMCRGRAAIVEDEAEKLTDNALALSSIEHLRRVYAHLKELKAETYVSFDLGTVKSLAYYSGMVFTGLAEGVGAPVLSGGRYDELCAQFGRDLSAVGFAVGLMRVLRALDREEGKAC